MSLNETLTSELGPDDGGDPRRFHDRRTWDDQPRPNGRKALQLCGQVKDALHGILAECRDDVVRDLIVVSVVPAPNSARLLVAVAVSNTADATDATDPDTILERLHRHLGPIRAEVAASINRRKVPELAFVVTVASERFGSL